MTKKFRLALFVYSVVCDLLICLSLCLTSSIQANSVFSNGVLTINFDAISWSSFGINFAISIVLALLISNFIPLVAIGKWFTKLFKINADTYYKNMPYRLTACFIITCVFFFIISPILTIFNSFIYPLIINQPVLSVGQACLNFLKNMPVLFLVDYVVSLIFDIPAYKVGHKIDENF